MNILYVKETDNTYQHSKVVFENLGIVVEFGPAGGKYPGSVTQAPGEMQIRNYNRSSGDHATKEIVASADEEMQALRAVKEKLQSKWAGRQYDAMSDNCIHFARDVMQVSANALNRGGRIIFPGRPLAQGEQEQSSEIAVANDAVTNPAFASALDGKSFKIAGVGYDETSSSRPPPGIKQEVDVSMVRH